MTTPPTLSLTGAATINGVQVFAGLGLTVAAGQWTCLLGASGVGKSTVLKLFAGLDDDIVLAGQLGGLTDGARDQVALMAQDDLLLPWLSVLDNVLLGARLRGQSPDRAKALARLEQVGLAEKATQKPGALSGGQRQRVALARTLMEDRPVVLLDEPFSALDAMTRAQMQELTAGLLQDRTVLLVTHDPGEAVRLGHHISIMTQTGVQEIAPPQGAVPRPVDDTDVLKVQATLLQRLRKGSP